jgi:hypothetical protein
MKMIRNIYIRNILDLLVQGHENERELKSQIELIEDIEYSHTGAGLIVTFRATKSTQNFRINSIAIINGVQIKSTEIEIGAEANLFLDNGIISYLEIHSFSSSYPKEPLSNYILTQAWLPEGGKKITYPE